MRIMGLTRRDFRAQLESRLGPGQRIIFPRKKDEDDEEEVRAFTLLQLGRGKLRDTKRQWRQSLTLRLSEYDTFEDFAEGFAYAVLVLRKDVISKRRMPKQWVDWAPPPGKGLKDPGQNPNEGS